MKKEKQEVNDVVEEKEKKKNSKIILYILLVIISLVGIFFLSTYIRWNADIKDRNEVLYYNQDDIKINSLSDFYGSEDLVELKENEAILMYCNSKYGGDCVTGDFSDNVENILRNPWVCINIVILLDLIIVYMILRNKDIKKIYVYILSVMIVLYGVYGIGVQAYKFFDYYHLVNDSEYIVTGKIVRGLVTNNESTFKPVVEYETDKGHFIKYIDYDIDGTIEEKINEDITLYYNSKNHEDITPRRGFTNYILPLLVSIMSIVIGIIYLKINREKKEEIK